MGKDLPGITHIAILLYNQIDFNINTFIQIKGIINNDFIKDNLFGRYSGLPELFGCFLLFRF